MENLKVDIEKCTTAKQVLKVLKKYNLEIFRDDSEEIGYFSIWINNTTRIYKPCTRKNMVFQTWHKEKFEYSGIPVFFG